MYENTLNVEKSESFVALSAKEYLLSAEDVLVTVANQAKNVSLDSCLFVTNNLALKTKLESMGAKVILPFKWFKFTAK